MYPFKPIVLSYSSLISYPDLFQFYILSLLLTENTQKLDKYINLYINEFFIKTTVLFSIDDFMDDYSTICISNTNLLNKNEPLRQSSNKKINKFIKNFNRIYSSIDPNYLINIYINKQINLTGSISILDKLQ